MKEKIISFVNKLDKDDIIKLAQDYDIYFSNEEVNFVYDYLKNNINDLVNNPNPDIFDNYKDKFSEINYLKIKSIINQFTKKKD